MMILKKLGAYFLGCVLLQLSLAIVCSFSDNYTHAHLLRLRFLIGCEMFMLLWSWLIWHRLTTLYKRYLPYKALRDVNKSLLILLILASHCCCVMYYALLGEEPHWLAILSFIAMAFSMYLFSFLFGFLVVKQAVLQCEKRSYFRRLLNAVWRIPGLQNLVMSDDLQTLVSLTLSIILVGLGTYNVLQPPSVKTVTIYLPNLAPNLHGLTIAHLTDIHVGPSVGRQRVAEVVKIVNGLKPDIITIAGDLVDGSHSDYWRVVEPLKELKSKYGTYFSTGNHEYYHGNVDEWFSYLESIRIRVLHNKHFLIQHSLCLAGVDDAFAEKSGVRGHKMDIDRALGGCEQRRQTIIVLCHQPRGAKQILKTKHKIDLILAGHTHAGQYWVVAPFAYLTNPYFYGLYNHSSGAQVYVSAGVHFWGPPVKNAPLEITQITLQPQKTGTALD